MDTDRAALEAQLSTLAALAGGAQALDATITPATLARSQPPSSAASIGPLPRIALAGEAGTTPVAHADLEILGVIGEGGMGRVHLARQRSLGRDVAIKMLKDEIAEAHAVEMLRAEATIMGRLEHPNVVPVHAVGVDPRGRLLLVMKRIDGAPWRDLLRDPEHPRWEALATRREDRLDAHLSVLVQVANALELAHQRGVVHRDVKPENVLLGAHGEVYLADWGVALRTEEAGGQDLVGTPAYMAPEMAIGLRAKIDARTDVFLLGATLHEVLTGKPPNEGATLELALLAAYECVPPRYDDSVPAELAAIATRAMARDPAERFASALELRRAIDDVRRHRGSIALTRAARATLADLARPAAEGDVVADVDRKLTECRFALVSALREWPENDDASRALATCLRLGIDHELARDNPAAARALLAELPGGDAERAARIEASSAKVAAREAELARLRSIDADADITAGLGARATMFGIVLLLGLAMAIFVALETDGSPEALSPEDLVRFAAIMLAALLSVIAVSARPLLSNAVGRRITGLFVVSIGGLLVHRLIALAQGVPVAATLTMDMVGLGIGAAASGTIVPRAGWSALPAIVAIVLGLAYPAQTPVIFSIATMSIVGVLLGVGLLELRARRAKPPAMGDRDS